MIEIGNAMVGLRRIYICSLSASIANLKFHGTPMLTNFQVELSKFKTHAIMIIDWPHDIFEILSDDIPLTMPNLAYLSLWNYYKLHQTLKHSYIVRVTATYDGFTYVLSEDNTFVTPPLKIEDQVEGSVYVPIKGPRLVALPTAITPL